MRMPNVLIIAGILCSTPMAARTAYSQVCAVPQQYAVFCSGTDGCFGQTIKYICSGYGTPHTTCGGACAGTINCCGHPVGYGLWSCGQQCAGCPDGAKVTKEAKGAEPSAGASKDSANELTAITIAVLQGAPAQIAPVQATAVQSAKDTE
jgi:hypothetical protein